MHACAGVVELSLQRKASKTRSYDRDSIPELAPVLEQSSPPQVRLAGACPCRRIVQGVAGSAVCWKAQCALTLRMSAITRGPVPVPVLSSCMQLQLPGCHHVCCIYNEALQQVSGGWAPDTGSCHAAGNTLCMRVSTPALQAPRGGIVLALAGCTHPSREGAGS